MDWDDYLNGILSQQTSIDTVTMGTNGNRHLLSPIIKASILMLMKMSSDDDRNHIFVFPKSNNIKLSFLISNTILDILSGTISSEYDPHTFEKGQKLKYEDCIVVFERCGDYNNDGIDKIWISFSNPGFQRGIPLKLAPYFQKVDSKKITKEETFNKVYNANRNAQEAQIDALVKNINQYMKNNKTHLGDSIVFVSEIKDTKNKLLNVVLNKETLSDILYLAQINSDGEILNMTSGQMSGNPAIVVASDLYSVLNGLSKGLKAHRIIVDISDANSVIGQLEAFDRLIESGIPITCVTDTAHSFETQPLKDRGFLEWRWNEYSITNELYTKSDIRSERSRLKNCSKQRVHYEKIEESNISDTIHLLYKHKEYIQDQSSRLISIYDKVFSLAFISLRNFSPLTNNEISHYCDILTECKFNLKSEKRFISVEVFNDLCQSVNLLEKAFAEDKLLHKANKIEELLYNRDYKTVCIIITEKQEKEKISEYWKRWCQTHKPNMSIQIMYQKEYINSGYYFSDLTIVPCWMNNKIMKEIIFSFSSPEYLVLLYNYENRWKNAHTKAWKRTLDSKDNSRIIKSKFESEKEVINIKEPEPFIPVVEMSFPDADDNKVDELEDIERFLLQNKYKQYNATNSQGSMVIDAIPISFVGGLLSFYRVEHEVITVTDIVQQTGDEMILKQAKDVEVGDFIAIRDAQKDLIREIADNILVSEGKGKCRELSQKWKESLKVEQVFSSIDEIYEKLQNVGCRKGRQTVINWLTNDELISPQSKEDLMHIAAATGDEVLLNKADVYYAAGSEVRAAHRNAGRILSTRLKQTISKELQQIDSLDPFNVWDPIEIEMEDIGRIRILKVIDVGPVVPVESINTNRLINE